MPVAATRGVRAESTVDFVVPCSAIEQVVAALTVENVLIGIAEQRVVAADQVDVVEADDRADDDVEKTPL